MRPPLTEIEQAATSVYQNGHDAVAIFPVTGGMAVQPCAAFPVIVAEAHLADRTQPWPWLAVGSVCYRAETRDTAAIEHMAGTLEDRWIAGDPTVTEQFMVAVVDKDAQAYVEFFDTHRDSRDLTQATDRTETLTGGAILSGLLDVIRRSQEE